LADLNEARLAMGYGRLPSGTDAAMLAAIELVQKTGFSMRTADGSRGRFRFRRWLPTKS